MLRTLLCGAALALSSITAHASEDQRKTSVGLGLGIPYGGVMGMQVAHGITDQLEFSGAIGGWFVDVLWSVSGRYFFTPSSQGDSGFRASLLYGTNASVVTRKCTTYNSYGACESDHESFESFEGLNLGLGWGHRAGESGWNIDLIVILTSGMDDEIDRLEDKGIEVEEDNSRLKLSFGYLWGL